MNCSKMSIQVFSEISSFARKVGISKIGNTEDFLIYNFEEEQKVSFDKVPLYRQGYYELLIDQSEGCSFSVDNTAIASSKNRITLIRPYQLQKVNLHAAYTELPAGFGIFFKPAFMKGTVLDRSFNNPSLSTTAFLDNSQFNVLSDLSARMHLEYNNFDPAVSKSVIQNYLEIMLLKLTRQRSTTHQPVFKNAGQLLTDSFYQKVQEHFLEFHAVADYAGLLHVSAKHLSETVKKESGKPALQFIIEAKMDYAKVLLLQTSKTVSQVAYELNFSDPNNFSAFFKKYSGKTPSEFRNS